MIKICFISILLFIFSGCRKEGPGAAAAPPPEVASILKGVQHLSPEEERLAFSLLTPELRYRIWVHKFDKLLQAGGTWNAGQMALIREMRQALQPFVFDADSDLKEIFYVQAKNWMERAKNSFTPEEFFGIGYSFREYNPAGNRKDPTTGLYDDDADPTGAKQSCHCNVGSSYTCPTTVVHAGTNGVWLETKYGHCNRVGECTESSYGCGYLMAWSCNGNICS
jgi:hypothetical protein